jgi:hypothetical protein
MALLGASLVSYRSQS